MPAFVLTVMPQNADPYQVQVGNPTPAQATAVSQIECACEGQHLAMRNRSSSTGPQRWLRPPSEWPQQCELTRTSVIGEHST